MKSSVIKSLSLVMALVGCFSCNGPQEPDENRTKMVIETEEVPLGSRDDFSYFDFDTPYIFTSAEDFKAAVSKVSGDFRDSLVCSTVDFSENSLIAVTGLASSHIRSIDRELYYYDGSKYYLDIFVNVADTCREARKWNLLIKVPFLLSNSDKIVCRVTTNQPLAPIKPNSIPNFGQIPYYGGPSFYEWDGEPYMIVYAPENHQKMLDIINAHPSATLLKYGLKKSELLPGLANNMVINCSKSYLEQYSDIIKIAPLDVYYYEGYITHGPHLLYVFPYCLLRKSLLPKCEKLLEALQCEYVGKWYDEDVLAYKTSKIHYLDFYSITSRYAGGASATFLIEQYAINVSYPFSRSEWYTKQHFDFELPESFFETSNNE